MSPIPISVFTGYLGAGKTTTILALLKNLPKDYKVVLLKNEFGDVEVDSKLVQQSSLAGVSEILNGCLCCVLVGQMQNALLEIRDKYRPDRIIIECSGSAFPATLAFQIRQLERDTDGDFKLDAIITVIDAENFIGYEDTSPTAKMQASYTDVILINKWEYVSERALDIVMDHLYTLNDETPKIRCQGKNGVDPNLLFDFQSKLALQVEQMEDLESTAVHDDVETVTIFRGGEIHHGSHVHSYGESTTKIDRGSLVQVLSDLPRETIWRVKGFVKLFDRSWVSINWAFGRHDIQTYNGGDIEGAVRITVMGSRGSVRSSISGLVSLLEGEFCGD